MHLFRAEFGRMDRPATYYNEIIRAKSARQAAEIAFDHSDESVGPGMVPAVAVTKLQPPDDPGAAGIVYQTNIVGEFQRGTRRPARQMNRHPRQANR